MCYAIDLKFELNNDSCLDQDVWLGSYAVYVERLWNKTPYLLW